MPVFLPWQHLTLTSEIRAVSHTLSHPWKCAVFMFLSFYPLLLPCTGNILMHKTILWELHFESHHLPSLTGFYLTLSCIKYFIVSCTVIDTELWLCPRKILRQRFMPGWLFDILQFDSVFSDRLHFVVLLPWAKILCGKKVMWQTKPKNQLAVFSKSNFHVHVKLKWIFDVLWSHRTASVRLNLFLRFSGTAIFKVKCNVAMFTTNIM